MACRVDADDYIGPTFVEHVVTHGLHEFEALNGDAQLSEGKRKSAEAKYGKTPYKDGFFLNDVAFTQPTLPPVYLFGDDKNPTQLKSCVIVKLAADYGHSPSTGLTRVMRRQVYEDRQKSKLLT